MTIYRIDDEKFVPVDQTNFAAAGLRERDDIQRRLRANVEILVEDEDILVITDEFGDWADSSRRIDLLCLDQAANLVVVELKRTEDAGHAELQALRYAAMVSNMTFQQASRAYAKYKQLSEDEAQTEILAFLGWEDSTDELFAKDVRIVLAAADFSKEITTTVMWLNARGIDVRCVRLKPYMLADRTLLVDVQRIIPLPEASEFLTRLAERGDEERRGNRHVMRLKFWKGVLALAKEKGAPNADRLATEQSWIGRINTVHLNYEIRATDVSVEIYIARGDKAANLRSFELLEAKKDSIEKITGPLDWNRLPEKQACRISCVVPDGGWKSPEDQWPAIQAKMIEAALAMDKAFRHLLPEAANA